MIVVRRQFPPAGDRHRESETEEQPQEAERRGTNAAHERAERIGSGLLSGTCPIADLARDCEHHEHRQSD